MTNPKFHHLLILITVSLALLVIDFATGPLYIFATFFVLPVIWCAWFYGAGWGCILGLSFSVLRFLCHWVWGFPNDIHPAIVNNVLRGITLISVSLLTAWLAMQMRERERMLLLMGNQLRVLRQKLPICHVCNSLCEGEDFIHMNHAGPEASPRRLVCARCRSRGDLSEEEVVVAGVDPKP